MTDTTYVYLVTCGEYEDYTVLAILLDESLAEQYRDLYNEHQVDYPEASLEVRPVLSSLAEVGPFVTFASDVHVDNNDVANSDYSRHIFFGPLTLPLFNNVNKFSDGMGYNILTTGLLSEEDAVMAEHAERVNTARQDISESAAQ